VTPKQQRLLLAAPLILLIVVIIAVVAGWFIAARTVTQALQHWTNDRRAEGYRIDYAAPVIGGFPFRLVLRLDRPSIEAPGKAWQWDGPSLTGEATLWRPLLVHVALPGRHAVRWGAAEEARLFDGDFASADSVIRLGSNGRLRSLTVKLAGIKTVDDSGAELTLRSLELSGEQPHPKFALPPESILAFAIAADGVTLPPQPVAPLGRLIETLAVEGEIKGPLAMGPVKPALDAWRAAGGTLELHSIMAKWGPLAVTGDGTLALDKAMQPIAALSLSFSGFSETLDALVASGLVDQKKAGLPRVILGALARSGNDGGKAAIKAPLTIEDGSLLVGPVKLMPVPPIDW
jgi:hypothetical protein